MDFKGGNSTAPAVEPLSEYNNEIKFIV